MAIHKDKKPLIDTQARIKIILIAILISIAFLLLNNNGMIKLFKAKQENNALIEQKEKLQNDKKYIEKTAREQYNMVAPGEKVYKVIEE
jgi:septum formation initiator